MPQAEFFSRLGLFVREGFLDERRCAELSAEMRAVEGEMASLKVDAGEATVDEEIRRTKFAHVSAGSMESMSEGLEGVRPSLEQHFSLELADLTGPQFLVYKTGDHFQAHTDNKLLTRRRITFVVFLNRQSDDPGPDTYGGGTLSLYGLLNQDERAQGIGLPVSAEVGSLIAFRSELVHSVSPVTHGERCSLVGWFLDP
jgi:predicted 2-oxoglutarate/Fe(II)-dependent dioxygenase YbiX